jgi:hypothetical protein
MRSTLSKEVSTDAARGVPRALAQRDGVISVESAAVLVILALFVALLVFALSGYVGSARDKGYTTEARNYAIAAKAVVGERFASGEGMPPRVAGASGSGADSRYMILGVPSQPVANAMAELMDVSLPSAPNEPEYWVLYLTGPASTEAVKCDGFAYLYYPQGTDGDNNDFSTSSENYLLVTYHMTPYLPDGEPTDDTAAGTLATDAATVLNSISYDPSATFSVYHGPTFTPRPTK